MTSLSVLVVAEISDVTHRRKLAIPTSRKFEISSETLFLFSVARSLRSQIAAILNTANSHKKLIPNKHCAKFMPILKKKLNVARK